MNSQEYINGRLLTCLNSKMELTNLVGNVVLPGDKLFSVSKLQENLTEKQKQRIGPGLRRQDDYIYACKAGVFRHKEPASFWIDNIQKRYVPIRDDGVIGVIIQRGSDMYKVDIGSSLPAFLGNLSFEGATKRNRPNLQIGDLVYCRLNVASKDMEPELTCVNANGKANGLGLLTGGYMFKVSLNLARRLINPNCLVIKLLAKEFAFEITVGLNGRVWVNAKDDTVVFAVANAVITSEHMLDNEIKMFIKQWTTGVRLMPQS